MKTLFLMSLVCALASLLAIFGVSAMTIVPGPRVELERSRMLVGLGIFLAGWLVVAFWTRTRSRKIPPSVPHLPLEKILVCVSIVYVLAICFLVLG
jgi:hypothetical protein